MKEFNFAVQISIVLVISAVTIGWIKDIYGMNANGARKYTVCINTALSVGDEGQVKRCHEAYRTYKQLERKKQ